MPIKLDAELCRQLQGLPWPTVTDRQVVVPREQPGVRDRDLVGGATWIRGGWRGVVVVRCDRALAIELAKRAESRGLPEDGGVHWLLRYTVDVVLAMVGRHAKATDSVTLAGAEIFWFPASCTIRKRAALLVGDDIVTVEVYERRGWQPPVA